jgi:regulator of RNase E activity RraA
MDKTEMLARYMKVSTPFVCDALDDLDLWRQTLPPNLRPLFPTTPKFCGFAYTLKAMPSEKLGAWLPNTYKRWAEGYDGVQADNVLVLSYDAGVGAVWGGLRSTRMTKLGCRGLVTDGLIRDTPEIKALGFPIWAAGRTPEDCRGRVEYEAHQGEIAIAGLKISPGDVILADEDGVVVIPSAHAETVLLSAERHDQKQAWIRTQIVAGRPASELMETYSRPGKSGT